MGYRTIEQMKTKDNVFIDRVNRFTELNGINGAKARKYFFMYNCTADENLAWATCEIKDDMGATLEMERYENTVTAVPTAPTTEEEPTE